MSIWRRWETEETHSTKNPYSNNKTVYKNLDKATAQVSLGNRKKEEELKYVSLTEDWRSKIILNKVKKIYFFLSELRDKISEGKYSMIRSKTK